MCTHSAIQGRLHHRKRERDSFTHTSQVNGFRLFLSALLFVLADTTDVDTPGLSAGFDFLNRPIVFWLLASVTLWFWHIHGPYGWALANDGAHTLEHLSFFLTSLAFRSLVIEPYGRRKVITVRR
jgi:cytochrome c oxidase assembly factor CtaG